MTSFPFLYAVSGREIDVKILNRYILRIFFKTFILSLTAFAGIYLLVDFLEKVDDFLEHGAGVMLYLRYFSAKTPLIFVQVVPMAVLMAVFVGVGTLTRNNELTAMRASGVSLYRVTFPLLGVAVAAALLQFSAGEFLVPLSAKKATYIMQMEVKKLKSLIIGLQNVWYREGSDIIHIKAASPEKNRIQGVTILSLDKKFSLKKRIDAPGALFNGETWSLEEPSVRYFDPATAELVSLEEKPVLSYDLGKNASDFALKVKTPIENMGYRELRSLSQKLEREGYDSTRYLVDMHGKLATPFACVIMAFVGIPFALSKGRKTSLAMGIALSVSIGIAYFILQAMLMSFGYGGILPPLVAAWAANLLFALLGIWMLLTVRQ